MQLNVFCNHKCGTTWLYRLLKEFSELNAVEFWSTNRGWRGFDKRELPNRACVMYRNADYNAVSTVCDAGVRIIRNPLSIITSAYFSHLKTHNVDDWYQLARQRKILEQVSESEGMKLTLAFLERSDFYHNTIGPLNALSNWSFDDKRYHVIKMEDFVIDPLKYLKRTIVVNGFDPEQFEFPDMNKYSFEAITGRKIGEVDDNHHFRSGDPSDWKNYIPFEVELYVKSHFDQIIRNHYPELLE